MSVVAPKTKSLQ